MAKNDLLVNTF